MPQRVTRRSGDEPRSAANRQCRHPPDGITACRRLPSRREGGHRENQSRLPGVQDRVLCDENADRDTAEKWRI
jgi:hypothetical protein